MSDGGANLFNYKNPEMDKHLKAAASTYDEAKRKESYKAAMKLMIDDELRAFYGLDRPILEQYLTWVGTVASGSLGRSFINGAPVTSLVLERFPRTIYLMAGGLAVSLAIALPCGLVAATHRASWV